MFFNLLFFIYTIFQIIFIVFAELNSERKTIDSIADGDKNCHCASEENFELQRGDFKSPGYPIQYCDLLNCKWHILPAVNSFIVARFEFFEIEEKYDILEVYQTKWNGSQLLKVKQASISGNDVPHEHRFMTSSINGGLLFHFITDNSEHNLPGFELKFYRTNHSTYVRPCPSPFYFATENPQNLPIIPQSFSATCVFSINSSTAIKLTIKKFEQFDIITVFETESFPKPFIQKQSGQLAKINIFDSPSLPLIVTSRTKSLSVLITSTIRRNDTPYDIQFESTESVCSCFSENLIVSRIKPLTLLSPGYPLEYCDQLNCSTKISLEYPLSIKNKFRLNLNRRDELVEILKIKFNDFHTEIDMDLLHLFIPFNSEMNEIISFGGVAKNIKSFTFDSPSFTLNFTTDFTVLDSGFNLTFEAIKKLKECLCHGYDSNLKILNAEKYSENNQFDANKCTEMDCFWKIEPLKKDSAYNNRLILKFNLLLSDNTEFVEACQGDFHERNPYCHRIEPFNTDTETKFEFFSFQIPGLPPFERIKPIFIWYHREFSSLNSEQINNQPNIPRQINFTYEWRNECTCGNTLLKASINNWKSLFSPDYPHTYCHSMHCLWNLEAPEGHHIVLNISEFSTEADQDFVTFFDGNDTTLKHMEMLSGIITFKNTVHSEQNIMTILFTSDASIQLNGFIIWYKAESNNLNKLIKLSEESSSNKLFLFFLFILFALIGILFLISRSNNSINNRIATIENIFRNLLPLNFIRIFNRNEEQEEGRNQLLENTTTPSVRFIRNNHSEQAVNNNRWNSFSPNNPFN